MAQESESDLFNSTTYYSPISYEQAYGILNQHLGTSTKLLLTVVKHDTQEVAHESIYDLSTEWTRRHQEQIAFWMRRVTRVKVMEQLPASRDRKGAA